MIFLYQIWAVKKLVTIKLNCSMKMNKCKRIWIMLTNNLLVVFLIKEDKKLKENFKILK